MTVKNGGTIRSGEFRGWHYRVQRLPDGSLNAIEDGAVLVLVWPPDTELRPLPARHLFVPLEQLEQE